MEVKLEVTSEETKPLEVKSDEIKPVEVKLEKKSEETKPLEKEDPGFVPDWDEDKPPDTTADKILRDMRKWYYENADDPEARESWNKLGNLTKK